LKSASRQFFPAAVRNRDSNKRSQLQKDSEAYSEKWCIFSGPAMRKAMELARASRRQRRRLAEMTKIACCAGGFTISTEACDYFYKTQEAPSELKKQVADNLRSSNVPPRRSLAIRKILSSSACVPVPRVMPE